MTSLISAILYRRGTVLIIFCGHCATGIGRSPERVRVVASDLTADETDTFSGACANCLPMAAIRCTLSKNGKSKLRRSVDHLCTMLSLWQGGMSVDLVIVLQQRDTVVTKLVLQ